MAEYSQAAAKIARPMFIQTAGIMGMARHRFWRCRYRHSDSTAIIASE
jgi:hypothetical protein